MITDVWAAQSDNPVQQLLPLTGIKDFNTKKLYKITETCWNKEN